MSWTRRSHAHPKLLPRTQVLEHVVKNTSIRELHAGTLINPIKSWEEAMDLAQAFCGGLDVHKMSVVACARCVGSKGRVEREVKTFGTTTEELLALFDWLSGKGITHVVMESTGVYWKPVWHILEGGFDLMLANAAHIRNIPGRKTDVNDAMWMADLLAHGLIRGSFVPPEPVQNLRTLTRTRKQLVQEKTQHTQRIQKTLEDTNIKMTSVLSDILGTSGRAILDALIHGETDPRKLSKLAHKRVKASQESIRKALQGKVTAAHRFLLKLHFDQVKSLEKAIEEVETEIQKNIVPIFPEQVTRLTTIPGISEVVAWVVLSEIGADMSRFPTVGHLISWAGLCPKNDESAGRKRSTRIREGDPWLRTVLVQAAWAAVRVKGSYFQGQFLRLKSRRGPQKAIIAVAASILTAIYYMLLRRMDFKDLGASHFDHIDKQRRAKRLLKQLSDLGYEAELKSTA